VRILAVRGQNLASLADKFEIDFEAEPIVNTGIFAITGPTGAGKTTLLDAICLALFDNLPRMDSADRSATIGRADIDGGQRVKYDDVRGILRHGAGTGFAEVDFVGQDGRRYRSRWEVNRARGRANGRLQEQKLTLTDLASGATLGDKKTDTLQQIRQRIHLTFEQFRRSVLLAQGDFDTFIKAGTRDRAELLEKITGTEVYAQLSQAAFARAKEEREAWRALETQLGEHQPLSADARAAAEVRARDAKLAANRIEAEKLALDQALAWYEVKARLEIRITAGETALTQALEADQAAEADWAALAVVLKAFSLRAELESAVTTRSKLEETESSLGLALAAEHRATVERDQATMASQHAKAESVRARAAYDAIGPELDRAKALDARIDATRGAMLDWEQTFARKRADTEGAAQALAEAEAALRSAHAQRQSDVQWLAEHQAVEALAIRIDDVAKDLSERLKLERDMVLTHQQIEHLEHELNTARAAQEEADATSAALRQRECELDGHIALCREVADAIDVPVVEGQRDRLMTIQSALNEAGNAVDEADRAQTGSRVAADEAATQELIVRQAGEVIAVVDAVLPLETVRLEEARRGLDLSEAAGSEAAEHMRLKLIEGQPCPVCGALEHPVTDVGRLLRDRLAGDRRRVAELEEKVSVARADRTRAETQIAAARDTLLGISRRQVGHERDLLAARAKWRASMAVIRRASGDGGVAVPTFPEDVTAAEIHTTLRQLQERVESLLGETRDALRRASDAEAEARRLVAERDDVRRALSTTSDGIQRLKDEAQTKAGEAATCRDRLQGMGHNVEAVCARLDVAIAAAFPDWRHTVGHLGAGFVELCRDLVEDWRTCRERAERVRLEMSRLESDLEGKRATLKAAETAVVEVDEQLRTKRRELDALARERAEVIGGRPIGVVRTEYQRQSEMAEQAWHDAETARSGAEQRAAATASQAASARQAVDVARSEHESAARLLETKLMACEITRAQAEAAVARGEAWTVSEQSRLDRLRDAVTKARAALTAIQESAQEHDSTGQPGHTPNEIAEALGAVEERRAAAVAELIEASSVLHHDDWARGRMAELMTSLEARRAQARVWEQLDELIGSADGAKFRRFAQSLTLSHLVQLANRHLADLQPRYELQRVPGSDLVLQVIDHNMADEVRGVHNLSGGERFLVSLALALGLASMSSNRGIKVESLFIDEGFGALDSTSLAMAVSVLEQLQATGRRVGVISHVDELKERIAVRIEVTPVGGGRSTVKVGTA
jgi:exonuclease SbcC